MTALDLITRSFSLIGSLASGESLGATEATDGLNSLNDMLDSWSTQNLLIFNKVREVFPLVASQQTYTMGVGGNFNTSRPQKIEQALIQLTGNMPVLELPMEIMNQAQFAGITLKTLPSTFPLYLYSDNAYPTTNISVWPIPTTVNNLVFYSWKPLADIAAISATLSLPPGYARALRYNLALELAPEYGRSISDVVAAIAQESKAEIKRMNWRPDYLRVDDTLRSKPAVWNYRTGE